MKRWPIYCWAALVISGLASCGHAFNPDYTQLELTGDYYVESDYEGRSSLYLGSAWLSQAALLARPVDSAAVAGNYVVVYLAEEQKYRFFPSAAKTAALAERTQEGPLIKSGYRRRLYQLVGDSALRLAYVR